MQRLWRRIPTLVRRSMLLCFFAIAKKPCVCVCIATCGSEPACVDCFLHHMTKAVCVFCVTLSRVPSPYFWCALSVVVLLCSIHWEPVAPGSHTVKFTLRTVWERSAGVYTKLVDGIPQVFAGAGMYQPVQGDRIKVLGPETPKFIVSNGLFREYLELTVTYNTEQVSKGDPTGTNLPHAAPHWSYEGTNWFEGITEWEVELPDSEKTYVAELQGCCRVNQMAHMQSNQGCIETMYGRGVLQLCETPFFLRSTINLQYIPPPVSFLPQMLAYSFLREDGTLLEPLVLPILDYRATRKGMVRIPEQPMTWPEKIRTEEEDAGGILYKLAPIVVENPPEVEPVAVRRQSATSESSFSRSSRHLLAGHLGDEEVPVDLEPLPKVLNSGCTYALSSTHQCATHQCTHAHFHIVYVCVCVCADCDAI